MRTAGIAVGVLVGGFVLLAVGFQAGAATYFYLAGYWARRRETAAMKGQA